MREVRTESGWRECREDGSTSGEDGSTENGGSSEGTDGSTTSDDDPLDPKNMYRLRSKRLAADRFYAAVAEPVERARRKARRVWTEETTFSGSRQWQEWWSEQEGGYAYYQDYWQSWYQFPDDDPQEEIGSEWQCVCPEGVAGNGTYCESGSWAVRLVLTFKDYEQACEDDWWQEDEGESIGNCGNPKLVGKAWLDPGKGNRCKGSHSDENHCDFLCPAVAWEDMVEGSPCTKTCVGTCDCDCHHWGMGDGSCWCKNPGDDMCVCQDPNENGDIVCFCTCDMTTRGNSGKESESLQGPGGRRTFEEQVVAPVEQAQRAKELGGRRVSRKLLSEHAEGKAAQPRGHAASAAGVQEAPAQRRNIEEELEGGVGYEVTAEGISFGYGQGYPYYVHTDCPCGLPPLPRPTEYWSKYWKEVKQVYANFLTSNVNEMTFDSLVRAPPSRARVPRLLGPGLEGQREGEGEGRGGGDGLRGYGVCRWLRTHRRTTSIGRAGR